jgi:hypothetical protein
MGRAKVAGRSAGATTRRSSRSSSVRALAGTVSLVAAMLVAGCAEDPPERTWPPTSGRHCLENIYPRAGGPGTVMRIAAPDDLVPPKELPLTLFVCLEREETDMPARVRITTTGPARSLAPKVVTQPGGPGERIMFPIRVTVDGDGRGSITAVVTYEPPGVPPGHFTGVTVVVDASREGVRIDEGESRPGGGVY